MKLMIVDDHAGVRTLIRQVLTGAADVVCECATGEEALHRAESFQPDFVTMDIRMPGLSGFQTAKALHRLCGFARIIIVTSYDQPDFRRAAADVGVAAFVIKENLSGLSQIIASLGDGEDGEGGGRVRKD